MNSLVNKLGNLTYTENDALTRKSTGSAALDFFSHGAALRTAADARILELFSNAFGEDRNLALRTLFYIRDVRGGQGERRVFRVIINWLAKNYPDIVRNNLDNIVGFGRFDDLLCLENTPVEVDAFNMFAAQIEKDINILNDGSESRVSLAAKWAPSENASSKETKRLGRKLREYLKWDSKSYRKNLSALREELRVVERDMCAQEWDNINYSAVPSRASLLYRKAFSRHDTDRYAAFLGDVKTGKQKINASVLYPYDIVAQVMTGGMNKIGNSFYPSVKDVAEQDCAALDVLWNALPNYLGDNPRNGLCVVDTSGSMCGRPISVAIGLGIYIAERNQGMFKDFFITFSKNPEFQKVQGANICEKVQNLSKAHWEQNTNLARVFELVLDTAVKNSVPQEEMPSSIYIVSDMEFDVANERNTSTNFEEIRKKYENSGYELPELVFWNVNSRNTQSPIAMDEARNAKLVSGCSPEILTNLLAGQSLTAYDLFLQKVGGERYNCVVI